MRDFSEFLGKHVTQAAKDAVLEEPIGTAEGADEFRPKDEAEKKKEEK